MDVIKLVRDWVKEVHYNPPHLLRTEYWLLKLNPKADLTLRIAALTHDIERAFGERRNPPKDEVKIKWEDEEYCLWHGERSAKFSADFLKNSGANQRLIEKVKHLVIYHELGGDEETNFIKDADSISFLEINAPRFISRISNEQTKRETKEKFNYMFNRISSVKAKKLARSYYNKAMSELEKI